MAVRENFTDEEWGLVIQAPLVAGFAVTAADPSGLIGAFQESAAVARAMTAAKADAAAGSLLAEAVNAFDTSEARGIARDGVRELVKGRKPAEACEAAIVRLREISGIVRSNAPAEADAFNAWLLGIADSVAQAAKEGGFLGFGGEAVSDTEHKALADIDTALTGAIT
ncbi:hypothetical protein [Tropicimonas marinistellae]|uniref:hypothetical protein n=1 Tax=Tropicimonas marinistellae TaxID=1739787 RepID=UPI00082B7155|nr:hypothetical protein [Tropicimonas marinistellae]